MLKILIDLKKKYVPSTNLFFTTYTPPKLFMTSIEHNHKLNTFSTIYFTELFSKRFSITVHVLSIFLYKMTT